MWLFGTRLKKLNWSNKAIRNGLVPFLKEVYSIKNLNFDWVNMLVNVDVRAT
jgi:hypothetical protein